MKEHVTVEIDIDSELLKRAREAGVDLSYEELERQLHRELLAREDAKRKRLAPQSHEGNEGSVGTSNTP